LSNDNRALPPRPLRPIDSAALLQPQKRRSLTPRQEPLALGWVSSHDRTRPRSTMPQKATDARCHRARTCG